MTRLIFSGITRLRQTYWFWPSVMTLVALILGLFLPYLDALAGSEWIRSVGFLRTSEVDGARAILTTLAGSTLGVAGVAFSVTIVAVSFASSNYGPRLIGNFMADRKNQVILGIFVATFVYCITVLSTVHASTGNGKSSVEAFVPQISLFFALFLTLTSVGALIAYIHHIPESINIMNLTADIGDKLQRAIIRMQDAQQKPECKAREDVGGLASRAGLPTEDGEIIRAKKAGFLQQINVKHLAEIAEKNDARIRLHKGVGDFLVEGEMFMSVRSMTDGKVAIEDALRGCYTQGTNRTDAQDVLFLSDQLVEVLARALSPGVNDPQTAVLCLNWLGAGLVVFAQLAPLPQPQEHDLVFYKRVTFEDMLSRSFDHMRQYVAADRTATLHALNVLTQIALASSSMDISRACVRQMKSLAGSAQELLDETRAREEVTAELKRALATVAAFERERQG